jgi:hypothetical protein
MSNNTVMANKPDKLDAVKNSDKMLSPPSVSEDYLTRPSSCPSTPPEFKADLKAP